MQVKNAIHWVRGENRQGAPVDFSQRQGSCLSSELVGLGFVQREFKSDVNICARVYINSHYFRMIGDGHQPNSMPGSMGPATCSLSELK